MPLVCSAGSKSIAELRRDLADRFPTAQRHTGRTLRTGIPSLDEAAGGLPIAAVTEIVCAAPSCGGHLLLGQLLAVTRLSRQRVALIDSHDSFDPASYPTDDLAHLIWVRCGKTTDALQAADLLARDANLALVVLDLRRAPEADLRRISGPQWYRFQRAVEPTDLAFVVETPRASVPSAQLRFALSTPADFTILERDRPVLITQLAPSLQRQRLQTSAAS
ncbi:MAG: hypothetical protein V4773_07200 [Verrucomicrobiota bacterium]